MSAWELKNEVFCKRCEGILGEFFACVAGRSESTIETAPSVRIEVRYKFVDD